MTKRAIAAALVVMLCCPASSSTTEQTTQFSAIVLGIGLGLFLIHRGQHTTPDAARSAEPAAAVPPFRLSHRYYLSSFLKRVLKRMENAIDELSNRVPTYSERALYAEDDAADAADAAPLANSITNTKSGN
jgi:hypothetical protein